MQQFEEFKTPKYITTTIFNPEVRLKGGERLITLTRTPKTSWFSGNVQIYHSVYEVWLSYNVNEYKWLIRPKKYYPEDNWEFLFALKKGEIPKDKVIAIRK